MDSIIYIGPLAFIIIVALTLVEELFRKKYNEEKTEHYKVKQLLCQYQVREAGDRWRSLGKDAEHKGCMVEFVILDIDTSARRVFVKKGESLKTTLSAAGLQEFVDEYVWIKPMCACSPDWDCEIKEDTSIFTYDRNRKENLRRR